MYIRKNRSYWHAVPLTGEYSVIRFGFKSKSQKWLFAIWREYKDIKTNEVNWAEVLFYI